MKKKRLSEAEYGYMSDTVETMYANKRKKHGEFSHTQETRAAKVKPRKRTEKQIRANAKKLSIPKTVQDSIPYVRVYPESRHH